MVYALAVRDGMEMLSLCPVREYNFESYCDLDVWQSCYPGGGLPWCGIPQTSLFVCRGVIPEGCRGSGPWPGGQGYHENLVSIETEPSVHQAPPLCEMLVGS